VDLDIEQIRGKKTAQGDGGLFEGVANKTKIRVVIVKLTDQITEIGIWTSHDNALAGLICERIKEEALDTGQSPQEPDGEGPAAPREEKRDSLAT
jgi:hypothetical protein